MVDVEGIRMRCQRGGPVYRFSGETLLDYWLSIGPDVLEWKVDEGKDILTRFQRAIGSPPGKVISMPPVLHVPLCSLKVLEIVNSLKCLKHFARVRERHGIGLMRYLFYEFGGLALNAIVCPSGADLYFEWDLPDGRRNWLYAWPVGRGFHELLRTAEKCVRIRNRILARIADLGLPPPASEAFPAEPRRA